MRTSIDGRVVTEATAGKPQENNRLTHSGRGHARRASMGTAQRTAPAASAARELVSRYFELSGDELLVDGVRVSRIVAEHGTPLFIYSGRVLDVKSCRLRS